MKVAFCADIHLGWKLYNQPELADDLLTVFHTLVETVIDEKIDVLVIAGDLYDTPNPSEDLVYFVNSRLSDLKQAGVRVVGITGDHDYRPSAHTTWLQGVHGIPSSTDTIVCGDYVNFLDVPAYCTNLPNKEKIEFLVFHGQEETLYPFVSEKKRLQLTDIRLEDFPNLKGIVLGDIHKPLEGLIRRPDIGREVPVVYCGSPGVIRSDEIGTKTGLLIWDGHSFTRKQILLPRSYIKVFLPDDGYMLGTILDAVKTEEKRPLLVVEYASGTDITSMSQFHEYCLVKYSEKRGTEEQSEVVNIRGELGNQSREEDVIKQLVSDEETRKLLLSLLHAQDYKAVLDDFRTTTLTTTQS